MKGGSAMKRFIKIFGLLLLVIVLGIAAVVFYGLHKFKNFPEDTMTAVAIDQLVPTANLMTTILRTADGYTLDDLR